VINLCIEANRRYPLDNFDGQPVMEFGFEDHNPRVFAVVVVVVVGVIIVDSR
jgi:hypothetical protein